MAALSIIAKPILRYPVRLSYSPWWSISIPHSFNSGHCDVRPFSCSPVRHFSLYSAAVVVPTFFTHWSVTQACQWTLENVHTYAGLPWWATIVGTTVAFKLLTSPLLYAGERALARYGLLMALVRKKAPEMKAEVDRLADINNLSAEKRQLWFILGMRKYELFLREQMRCHPLAMATWSLLQAPIWIGVSFAVRNLSGQNPRYPEYDDAIVDEMSTEGLLWFSNLAIPDPFCILPVVNGVLYLWAPTLSILGSPPALKKTPLYRIIRAANVGVTCFITYVGLHLPAVLTLYWLTSMFVTLVLRLILKLPRVRRTLAIDRAPFESETPVRELALRTIGKWKPEAPGARKPAPVKK